MKNKICPICGSKNSIILKDLVVKVRYYDRTSSGKSIKIWYCKNCDYNTERKKKSIDKINKREFIKLRNKVTKEMIRDIMKFYDSKYSRYSEIERLLFLKPNYFTNLLNNKRNIKPEDAALIAIIYNFPFIIKCAYSDFDVNKSIKYIKEFISNLEDSMGINAKEIVENLTGTEEPVSVSKKE